VTRTDGAEVTVVERGDREPGRHEVDDLGDDEGGNHERPRVCLEQLERLGVMRVVPVDVGVERTRVDNEGRYRSTSAARISSMRAAMSLRPL
jgi:hypothetical protein